ncbi:flagellar hook-length control protein [Bradyrhizobium nitroreducens]|uniref:Flagellar hook-length control protein n=1 Tax=Bradyrhizobium nitroreducens TaxID=709803 RepID=A0A2M6U9A0_9BRAD|nr:flagellar hook-length control protein FliK [Bradyrhizobium nitroreducens]PIT01186.1 flagellar hook-length control protein [Bradyrhizobium nitroreducens]
MVSRTSDVVASVQVSSTQQKPARSQSTKDAQQAPDSFGSLVDSNTQAISTKDAAQDNAPRRSDSSSADKGPRDTSSTDQPAQSKASDDTDTSAPARDDKASDTTTDPAKDANKDKLQAKDKAKDKSETSDAKSADETKGDKAEATDGLAAAVDAAATAPADAALAAVPDPNAIVVAAPSVPTDANAATNQAATSSPLTIAAAGIAASASTAAQIAGGKTDTATPGDKSAKTAGAKVDADTSAALGDAATGATDAAATDTKPSAGLVPANQGTPKTSFQAAVATAQGQSDVSNIGQDTGKANAATAQAPGATTANAAAHPQVAKPQADGAATETKPGAADRTADATQGAPTTPAHAGTQGLVAPTDTSAQAASAVQAPLTNTTSTASASTATLTATAATNTAVPINGVPVEIAAAIRSGKSRFDISLDPAELGRIDVRINVDRAGNVTSHLTVEKPETLQMLRQDAPQLQRALDDAGLKTGSNGLSFSLRDQNSSGQNSGQSNDNGGNARRLIISEDDSVSAAPVGRSYGRMLGSSSGVDIRV